MKSIGIEKEIKKVRSQIEKKDSEYLLLISKEKPELAGMAEEINSMVPYGKKMRPLLMCLGYAMAGGRDEASIIEAACSMDMLQYAMLIFDDVMDSASTRHGKITIHQKFKRWVRKKYLIEATKADHYGRSVAELAGLFALECSRDILARSKFDPEFKVRALLKLSEIIMITIAGQGSDLKMGLTPIIKDLGEKNIIKMMDQKTGIYTIGGPVQIGAILAGADNIFIETITPFAIPLGIAFQIRDDVIGMFGDEAKTGKSAGSDIIEGKRTLLVFKAWENASLPQKWVLKRILGNKNASITDIEKVREIVRETGSLDYCEDLIQLLADRSKQELERIKIEKEHKMLLEELVDLLTTRDY